MQALKSSPARKKSFVAIQFHLTKGGLSKPKLVGPTGEALVWEIPIPSGPAPHSAATDGEEKRTNEALSRLCWRQALKEIGRIKRRLAADLAHLKRLQTKLEGA